MPFVSRQQAKWGNSEAGRKALGNKIDEWNSTTDFKHLPARIGMKGKKMSVKNMARVKK